MFTLSQINDIHDRFGKQTTLLDYLHALHAIGVVKYDSFLTDGHSEYYGKDNHKVVFPPVHETLSISGSTNRDAFLNHLSLHEDGKTSYTEMSKGLADSGIEKWTFDTNHMTIAYYDVSGNEMLVEKIE